MVDLQTTYLGLNLKNPLVASASPLSEKVDSVRRLEDAGVAAVVMYSLFEEQIVHESLETDRRMRFIGAAGFQEAQTYLPEAGSRYSIGPDQYLEHLSRLKEAVDIPVIGSLNGYSTGGWIEYAQKMEQAGADAVELNIYFLPFDPDLNSELLEKVYVSLVRDIRESISIPIAVKLSPHFTGMANFARQITEAGANGLVLFNRFYQPDFDLEKLEIVSNLELSTSSELRLPLRWIALLYDKLKVDFALTTGVHTAVDMIKGLMAGASVTMVASALLRNGPGYAATLLADLQAWMEEKEYVSVQQMKGSMSDKAMNQPPTLMRANYIKVLDSYKILP